MRVVAGIAGGITLLTPKTDVRPTMDKVRAAIFSSLGDRVPSARVLDLFAGSGALGIEALSRGAECVLFVDQSRESTNCIQANLERCHLQGIVKTVDAFAFLNRQATPHSYDLIFADPPYRKKEKDSNFAQTLIDNRALLQALSPDGLFILEKYIYDNIIYPPHWELIKSKRYGQTDVCFLQLRNAE